MLQTSNFLKLVLLDERAHFLKRLAYIDSKGRPAEFITNDPRHLFVQETSTKLLKVTGAIDHAKSLLKQIEITPPIDWLDEVEISRYEYIQQNVDMFSVVLFSSLDRSLFLVNHLTGICNSEREVTYKNIAKAVRAENSVLANTLAELYKETKSLANHRNFFSHRGENRNTGRLSSIRRVRTITTLFKVPIENVKFLDKQAEKELMSTLKKEISAIEPILFKMFDAAASIYVNELGKLGGVDSPNNEELSKASEAIDYFSGGKKPGFMNF